MKLNVNLPLLQFTLSQRKYELKKKIALELIGIHCCTEMYVQVLYWMFDPWFEQCDSESCKPVMNSTLSMIRTEKNLNVTKYDLYNSIFAYSVDKDEKTAEINRLYSARKGYSQLCTQPLPFKYSTTVVIGTWNRNENFVALFI